MKKIIAAFDGLKYSESTQLYAFELAKKTNTRLVGVFLDDFLYNSYKVYDIIIKKGVTQKQLKTYEDIDKEIRDASAKKFEAACRLAKLEYVIHHDSSIALQELKHESLYTDLLIINATETFNHNSEAPPTHFIRDLLSDTQCPVLVVPKKYKRINKLMLLYDGEPSSVHAIKMFSYLLPALKDLDTEVICVNPGETSLHLPNNKLMKEFMKQHYPNAKFNVMKGDAENEIVHYLKQVNENVLVVLGAYRRGTVSRWFRESMADILMHETKFPLFIAHK